MKVAGPQSLCAYSAHGFVARKGSMRDGKVVGAKVLPSLLLRWEALSIWHFGELLGKVREIFFSQSQGFIYMVLGTNSSECLTLANSPPAKRGRLH